MAVSLNKNSFPTFTCHPLFSIKTNLRENRFLRQGERLVARKGTHNVKFCTKKLDKNDYIVYTNMVNSMRSTYAYNTSDCGTGCSWATETEHGNEEVIYQFRLTLSTTSSKIRQAICRTTHKICTGTDKPIGVKSEDYFILKVLFRSS